MPSNLVKPGQEADWERAKKLAEEQGKKENWPYVNSIFQSLIGNKQAAFGEKEKTYNVEMSVISGTQQRQNEQSVEVILKKYDSVFSRYRSGGFVSYSVSVTLSKRADLFSDLRDIWKTVQPATLSLLDSDGGRTMGKEINLSKQASMDIPMGDRWVLEQCAKIMHTDWKQIAQNPKAALALLDSHKQFQSYQIAVAAYQNHLRTHKQAAVGRMPGNALTNPARYGLMPCDVRYGQIVDRPRQQVLTTGNQCRLLNEQLDEHTFVWFFVGLGADNKPILARSEHELEQLSLQLEKARLHSESVHLASAHWSVVRVAARYVEMFERKPEGEGSMVPPLRDINGENFKAPEFDTMELLGYRWKDTSKAFHNPQPEPAGVIRMPTTKTAASTRVASKPVYVGAFLTHASKQKLLHAFPAVHPQVFAEHCTLWFKPSETELAEYTLGDTISLHVRMGYLDERGQAVTVDVPNGIPCKNPHPHVTVSCAPGTAPVYSNTLVADRDSAQTVNLVLEAVVDTFPRSQVA